MKGLTCRDRRGRQDGWTTCPSPALGGEILGIAGIAGSGQKELLEAIAGLQPAEAGSVLHPAHPTRRANVRRDRGAGGQDPHADRRYAACPWPSCRRTAWAWAWLACMDMTDNMMLTLLPEAARAPSSTARPPRSWPSRLVDELEVVTPGVGYPGAPAVRRQRAEGAGGPGDRLRPHRADDRLRRPGPGHQLLLHHL